MRALLTEVQRWRMKAGELRAVADTLKNAVARDHVLEMADRYDGYANKIEDLEIKRGRGVRG